LTSALDGQPHALAAPGTQWIGGWMGPKAGLDAVERRKKSLSPAGNRTQTSYLKIGETNYSDASLTIYKVIRRHIPEVITTFFGIVELHDGCKYWNKSS
jgi:hypothetical protein